MLSSRDTVYFSMAPRSLPPLGDSDSAKIRSCSRWCFSHSASRLRRRGDVSSRNFFALVAGSLLLGSVVTQAGTLTVTRSGDHGRGTLRKAIFDAEPGDTINFADGLRTINLTSAELRIEKDLTINGPGANRLTIRRSAASGTPNFRIFSISGYVTISGVTIAKGFIAEPGGGISNGGKLTVSACAISGNTALDGAGIYNGGTLTVRESTLSRNSAVEGGNGGGLYNGGTAIVTRSTFFRNFAALGGAIINNGTSTITISNSTLSRNSAGNAGAIYNNNSTITLTNSTVSGNSATETGGITTNSGTFNPTNARNSIIAKNTDETGRPDFQGRLDSQGYNLIGNTSGTSITGTKKGNQLNVDPKLGPLQNNGGPTFTKALLSDSPAIDRGDSGRSITDQRGFTRPVDNPNLPNAKDGNGSDIGAFEVQAATAMTAAESPE